MDQTTQGGFAEVTDLNSVFPTDIQTVIKPTHTVQYMVRIQGMGDIWVDADLVNGDDAKPPKVCHILSHLANQDT